MISSEINPAAPARQELTARHFDHRIAASFYQKSVSDETRRAYRRAVANFFQFVRGIHPTQVTSEHVLEWRDHLRAKKKRAATIAFNLSVVRSFFEYLKAAGVVTLNPASTKLVPPPEVPSEPAGRALTPKEVRYLLSGPDRSKSDGARAAVADAASWRAGFGSVFVKGFVDQVEPRPLDREVQS